MRCMYIAYSVFANYLSACMPHFNLFFSSINSYLFHCCLFWGQFFVSAGLTGELAAKRKQNCLVSKEGYWLLKLLKGFFQTHKFP